MTDLPAEIAAKVTEIATQHGMSAASWVFDGNTDRATYERMLRGIDEGDPEILDSVREPSLAGEYGDDWTERDLACYLDIDPDDSELSDQAASAYEDEVRSVFWAEVERVARFQTAPCDD